MMKASGSILVGHVTHKRVAPVCHKLKYGVFSLLVDLDRIGDLERRLRLFSHNRFNLLSLHDRDLADGRQKDLAEYARGMVRSELGKIADRVLLLTYPRVLGYVFNPLSVYLCLDRQGEITAAIYEVSNTFGERVSYVCEVRDGVVSGCNKTMLVSPFNRSTGRYGFRLHRDGHNLTVGVTLHEAGQPVIATWFRARQREFTDRRIAICAFSIPFMTVKVIAAIYYEALKLWLKGLRPSWKENALHMDAKFGREPKHSGTVG